ncbi:hypothetical protein ACFVXE_36800 [Streptomyces sp. NPDC058231]|uniref:hypothetical protein n=1 Tax=Streptomyces sp. NPDC058231 TaxID=3346392 RepID=UPI0036E0EA1A
MIEILFPGKGKICPINDRTGKNPSNWGCIKNEEPVKKNTQPGKGGVCPTNDPDGKKNPSKNGGCTPRRGGLLNPGKGGVCPINDREGKNYPNWGCTPRPIEKTKVKPCPKNDPTGKNPSNKGCKPTNPQAKGKCSVSVSPTSVYVGHNVRVRGAGFAPNTAVTVSVPGATFGVPTSGLGQFATNGHSVPLGTHFGSYTVTASDGTNTCRASLNVFQVEGGGAVVND